MKKRDNVESEGKSAISRIFIISFIFIVVLMFLFTLFFSGKKNQLEDNVSGALYNTLNGQFLFILLGIVFFAVIVLMILFSLKKKTKISGKNRQNRA